MGIQFLFGISGSGKTEYLLRRAIREAEQDLRQQFYIVVPEQDTLSMQRRVVSHPENKGKGILNIDVISFNRLAYRVFQELNQGIPRIIDDSGKVMILRETAEKVKGELHYYSAQLNRPGFLSELKSQISEFYQYRILPELVEEMAERSESVSTRNKLRDLGILYRAFRDYMEAHGYLTKEELLDRLLERLPESRILERSHLFFDGFTGFTPVQLDLIEEMMGKAEELCLSLDLRGDEVSGIYEKRGAEDLFFLTRQTVQRITERARKQGMDILAPINLNDKAGKEELYPRFQSPALEYLAEHIYQFKGQEKPPKSRGIELWEAPDIRSEVERAAECISEAVREGKRYSELGILLSSPEEYQDIIFRVFSAAGIPYFWDDGRSLLDSPYAEFIRSALLVPEKSFSFDAVLRYLRSLPVMSPGEENEIDLFENFLRQKGLRGIGKYRESWEEYEELKQRLLGALLRFSEASGRGSTARERTEALKNLLIESGSRERIERAAEGKRAEGEQNLAEELLQGMERIEELLDRLGLLLGDTVVSRREYIDILDSGLKEEKLRLIPATMDQVVLGDLTRSRFSNPKIFLILGANAVNLPKAKTGNKILGDKERALFKEMEIELAPTREEDSLMDRFYIYRAFATPCERLILSYAVKGRGGKGLGMSPVMEKILQMFPDQRLHFLRNRKGRIFTEGEALRFLSRELPEYMEKRRCGGEIEKSEEERLLRYMAVLSEQEEGRERLHRLLRSGCTVYESTKLEQAVAKLIYGEIMSGSISRLEQFNDCAYAHFLKYGLGLSERRSYEIQAFDIGNLYHRAIELAFLDSQERKTTIDELSPEALRELSERVVRKTAEESRDVQLLSGGRNQYILHKLSEITKTTLWALAEQLRRGDFKTIALERDFDLVRDGIRLRGRIDRVDTYEDESRVYVKIIDYKSGRTEFSLQKVYDGIQIQLVTYMNIMMTNLGYRNPGKEIVPAGIFYYRITDPVPDYGSEKSEEDIEKERLKSLRVDGLVNTDLHAVQHMDREIQKESDVIPVSIKDGVVDERKQSVASTRRFKALQDYVEQRIRKDSREIMDGEISAAPMRLSRDRTACTYCPYHSVCGFDTHIEGFRYRNLTAGKDEAIWESILKEEEKNEN